MTDEAYKAKQELLLYKQAKKNIQDIKNKIEIKQTKCNAVCKPVTLNESQRSSSGNSAEKLIDALIDLKKEYYNQQVEAEQLCLKIENKISDIKNDLYKRILRNFYLYGQSLESIAANECYHYVHIKKCHMKALNDYGSNMLPNVTRQSDIIVS